MSDELARNIADAQAEISAALHFYTPPFGENVAYARDRLLQSLISISRILVEGADPYPVCGACGEPIADGARHVWNEDGEHFHPACIGMDEAEGTPNDMGDQLRAELPTRIAAAKAYFDAGGCFANLEDEQADALLRARQEQSK